MDHEDLMKELPQVEKMPTQERLKLARKRRALQMEKWRARERELAKRERNAASQRRRRLTFEPSVTLLEAAARNDVEEVRRLLSTGVDPNSTNEDGLTALHQCCIDDSGDMMRLLVDHGADVNAEDSERWTPLHAAATCGHLHLVEFLVSRGANLLAVNADGNMPYDICEDDATLDYIESEMAKRGVTQALIEETRGSTEAKMLRELRELRTAGGNMEFRDEQDATPLHISAANGYAKVALFLLEECHVTTDPADVDGWQPIHAAAVWGHIDILELLVLHGANLNARTRNGETPADICEDPDVRDRILQLRNEQEREIREKTRDQRLRRTQSTNTRTQSVRRHSIRDKAQTPRKEAREEARIRLQQAFNQEMEGDSLVRQRPDLLPRSEPVEMPPKLFDPTAPNHPHFLPRNSFGGPGVGDTLDDVDGGKMSTASLPAMHLGNSQAPSDSVNLNVHVTVTLNSNANGPQSPVGVNNNNASPTGSTNGPGNTGTLSDLKKQRAIARSQHNSVSETSNGGSPVLGNKSLLLAAPNGSPNSPASPSSPRKFVGDPSEVIGSSTSQKACCVIL